VAASVRSHVMIRASCDGTRDAASPRRRILRLLIGLLVLVAVAACDDVPEGTPTPAAAQAGAGSSGVSGPGSLSPAAFLLRAASMRDYSEASNSVLTADAVARAGNDPAEAAQLQQEGYLSGAEAVFQQPMPAVTVTPFYEVRSRAYLFGSAAGASAFFTAESARVHRTAQGGSVTDLSAPPHDNTDGLVVLQAINAADPASAGPQNRAYLALARHGSVVVELYARINSDSTTDGQFDSLLQAQEATLGG
jgi:hypothetical protein